MVHTVPSTITLKDRPPHLGLTALLANLVGSGSSYQLRRLCLVTHFRAVWSAAAESDLGKGADEVGDFLFHCFTAALFGSLGEEGN